MNPLLARYESEHAKAKAKHDADVAHAAANKTALPDNYWHAEHNARQRLRVAREVIAALETDR